MLARVLKDIFHLRTQSKVYFFRAKENGKVGEMAMTLEVSLHLTPPDMPNQIQPRAAGLN